MQRTLELVLKLIRECQSKILTAAHCVIQNDTYVKNKTLLNSNAEAFEFEVNVMFSNRIPDFDQFFVKLGMHFLNETADDATLTMRINEVHIHEKYTTKTQRWVIINPSDLTVICFVMTVVICVDF
jgi:hypothetical protein